MLSSLVRPVAAALAVSAALVLTGCSAVQSFVGGVEPERDEQTGEIVEAVQANAFALRVGDCMNSSESAPDEVQSIESVPTVPCDQPHDSEIYAANEMTDEQYPGDEAVTTAAEDFCFAEFERFVGITYEDSSLYFSTMFPTAESWEFGDDREILCVVVDETGGLTETLADAAY